MTTHFSSQQLSLYSEIPQDSIESAIHKSTKTDTVRHEQRSGRSQDYITSRGPDNS
ncbi:hypothetical protein L798_04927 [Zootermopsis nevadensis]|uniref:Uncharacterized protein n=1 Tax=Zootermopsis nevadensis TaxID=136037 RepID=A0A067RBZ4_ZOONE|nr:hypothetical protein L798_04927 [Zootermopsis nevadensis]